MKPHSVIPVIALLICLSGTSCLKKAFDAPPDLNSYDPRLPVTATIAQLKAMNGFYQYQNGGDTTTVTSDITIAGIVTADDRSGNFYKAINMEDSTGGIQLQIDAYSLYAHYPVGRKIYVKCQGLTLGYNGGTPVLGMGVDDQMAVQPITGTSIAAHIIKADAGHAITPKAVTLAQLAASGTDRALLNRLVTIEDAEFTDSLGDKTYAQPNGTTNRNIRDCNNKKIAVRTSNYAGFAAIPLPAGKGSITGVFSIFTSSFSGSVSPQLTIRDTGDVRFYGARCGGGGIVNPPAAAPLVSIDSIRKLYTGSSVKLGAYRIHGTVISDAANKNISTGSFMLQSGTKGMNIYMGGTVPYAIGDSLIIDVTGDSLKPYANMLEIDGVKSADIKKIAANMPVMLRVVTIAALNADFSAYEATLVKVLNAAIAGGGIYSGNKTLDDGTGAMVLRTATTATFATQTVPAAAKTYTGIAGWFNKTRQLSIRNPADVQ